MSRFPPPFSRSHRAALVVAIVCLLTSFASIIFVAAHNDNAEVSAGPTADASTTARIAERFGNLPLSFEINKGQVEQPVKFVSRGPGYVLFLTPAEAVLTLEKPRTGSEVREGSVLRLKMIGANAAPDVEGREELPGKVNYFIGNNPDKWRRNISTYRKVHYKEIYPGIDMVYYGNQGELEYDFVVAAGANPKAIKFRVEGAERLRVDDKGNLLLALNDGEVRLNKPLIYQLTAEGERRDVKGAYVVKGNEISFKVRGFDAKKPLVIDPVLSYSTFLGGGSNEFALGIAVDFQGNAYVTGITTSNNFPTTAGAFKTTLTNFNSVFVSKLDATGSNLVYSTYLSGSTSGSSTGNAIAVDSSGNAHVTGSTSQTDFPTVNALKTTGNFFKTTDSAANWNNNNIGLPTNPGDISKIAVAPNAPNTVYATAFGGPHRSTDGGETWLKTANTGIPQFTFVFSLAVDPTNSLVVYGGFGSGLFKTTDGGANWSPVNTIPLNNTSASTIVFHPSTPSTMFVAGGGGVFRSTDSGATWTALNNGLPNFPSIRALAIDPTTPSTMYVGTFSNGLFKTTNGGGNWTAMNNGMGGPSPTSIGAIVIDPFNSSTIYTGHGSQSFGGSFNKSTNGGDSWTPINNGVPVNVEITGMVADRTNASTVYAATSGAGVLKTTDGGANWTNANAGLWNANVRTVAGHPFDSATLFVGTNTEQSFQDGFVTKLNSSGSGLLFSTFLGGSSTDFSSGIAVDGSGNISVTGQTGSTNFPAVNAMQPSRSPADTCVSAFVSKINPAVPSYVFSTYLGGTKCDSANAVATDPSGNVYVTGTTSSNDFPLAGAFQGTLGDSFIGDAFVTKLTSAGALSYSTFLGGNGTDITHAIAADVSGNAYVTGVTTSTNFPTANPIQATNGGFTGDVFVTKLNPQGSALVYSTYLGGSGGEIGRGIAVDSTGSAFITGFTSSQEFPLVPGALRTRSVLFKSGDGGANWSNDNYGIRASSIASIAIHQTQPATIYAGTNAGVFKSTNGGRTWLAVNNGLNAKNVIAVVIDPTTPSTIYAATSEFSSLDNGVYKSTDGGNSWNLRKTGMNNTSLLSLAIDPVTPATLYAGVSGSPSVYKTTDGADNWAPAGNALPFFFPISLAVDPHTPSRLFVAESSSAGGVFRSIDSGSTWQSVGLATTGAQGLSVAVSPLTADLVYAVTNGGGIFKSVDGGTNWSSVRAGFGKIVFDPVSSSTLYFISGFEGVLKSTDSGQTWVLMNNGLERPSANALAIDPIKTSTLYVSSSASPLNDDAFVTKINPAGSALIYSTLIGGTRQLGDPSGISAQAFALAIDSAGNAYITGLARGLPTTPNAFQPSNRGFEDAFVSKLTMSFIISGHVLEGGSTPVSGAEVVLNDGGVLTTFFTESDGSYEFSRLREGGSFTVSATKPHFTMAPQSQSFSNLNSDQVLNFTATATNAPFFTIGGQVTENGTALAGVTVTLSGSQVGTRTTDSNGNYSFELAGGGNYTVTPALTAFTFAPPSHTFNNLSANQTANFASTRQNLVVTNTNDHGAGSLRQAIITANATIGLDTIVFNIPGSGVQVINPLTALPEITDRVVIDGTTQPGFAGSPLITLDGIGLFNANGLFITAGNSTVRGLAFVRFNNAGITLSTGGNNVIQGNYIGVDATGTTARPNVEGIIVANSANNLIGGTTAAARNVISGNTSDGIALSGSNNLVQGNFIGTNAAGTAEIGNGQSGVTTFSSQFANNLIGGTAPGAGNLISGNQRGISISSPNNTIQGNLVGTDATGTNKIPNSNGMDVRGMNNLVGGLTPAARNIISGNAADGVIIGGSGSKLQGNYIGTDVTGTLALGNGGTGVVAGDNTLIGGTVPEARNIISGNGVSFGFGNLSIGSNSSGSEVTVQGNYIGTDVTGTRALFPDTLAGISISSPDNVIGGVTPGARNVISGNRIGIQIGGFSTAPQEGNVIQGNLIGLNALGTGLPNSLRAIAISDASNNIIGGTQAGAGNTIAFNGGPGVVIFSGTRNAIRGNAIFSNNGLGIDLATNQFPGEPNGVTPNDLNDPDTGANNLQNFPLLTSVLAVGGNTTIQGSLNSTPNTTFQIDFYSSAALDPSGNGEGGLFFNTTSVSTDANGNATINVTFPAVVGPGRVITATATDPNGNTSEFSAGDASGASGDVHFSVSSIQVIEDLGLLTVTVQRTGGSTGSLTVDFATADGTAIAGQDYTAASGTLTFNGGETSKTFNIPILDDATTEPDETFTVALRNASNIDSLGVPNVLTVILQDRTTVPTLGMLDASVVEGTGTNTDALFLLSLSAATGRTVSVNFATGDLTAFGGTTCNTRGVDYETKSTTITFQPGTTLINIPVRVCGDTAAEANEFFEGILSNPSNATILQLGGIGTIVNDDVLQLILEESGPTATQAAALDALLQTRDPFGIVGVPDWWPTGPDKNTRVILFAKNLELAPNQPPSAVVVRIAGLNTQFFDVPAESVLPIHNFEFTQVVIRLPNNIPVGTRLVTIRVNGRVSNAGTIRVQ